MFYEGDLHSGIGLAVRQSKAVLCFVYDDTETSSQWEAMLHGPAVSSAVISQAVALRLKSGSPQAGFLAPICAINSTPAIIVIKNAQVQTNLQSADVPVPELERKLESAFGIQQETSSSAAQGTSENAPSGAAQPEYIDLQPQPGQMRLPNNAYDALRTHTQKLLEDGVSPAEVFQTQLALMGNIPIFKEEVLRLRADTSSRELSEYATSRLLRLPAVGLKIPGQSRPTPPSSNPVTSPSESLNVSSDPSRTVPAGARVYPAQNRTTNTVPPSQNQGPSTPAPSTSPPAQEVDEKQRAQRADYIKMQREREQKARDERERIKAQIKADREERRRVDELRKQGQQASSSAETDEPSTSTYARSGSSRTPASRTSDIRIQVRTFDGSNLRNTFPPSSTISSTIRPWIDSATASDTNTIPYNLKLILTPLPNRTIEAGEEETSLSDLGIVGSCTFVMVPVEGYVESYAASRGGFGLMTSPNGLLGGVGGIVQGGYNVVSGTAGWALGGVKSLLGYGGEETGQTVGSSASGAAGQSTPGPVKNVRIRTLADQRAEEQARKDQQFYNGNQTNYQPKKGDGYYTDEDKDPEVD